MILKLRQSAFKKSQLRLQVVPVSLILCQLRIFGSYSIMFPKIALYDSLLIQSIQCQWADISETLKYCFKIFSSCINFQRTTTQLSMGLIWIKSVQYLKKSVLYFKRPFLDYKILGNFSTGNERKVSTPTLVFNLLTSFLLSLWRSSSCVRRRRRFSNSCDLPIPSVSNSWEKGMH